MAHRGPESWADSAGEHPERTDDLPLHPAIRGWLRSYAEASPEEHDRIVAEMLLDLNTRLVRRPAEAARR